jgi:hypothetical protein
MIATGDPAAPAKVNGVFSRKSREDAIGLQESIAEIAIDRFDSMKKGTTWCPPSGGPSRTLEA